MSSPATHLELVQDAERAEADFRQQYPFAWIASMVGPVVVTAVVLTIIGLSQGWTTSGRYLIAAAATFMLFGRFVILFGSDASVTETVEGSDMVNMLTSEQLFCMVTYMDVMTALFVAFNVGLLFRLPIVGPPNLWFGCRCKVHFANATMDEPCNVCWPRRLCDLSDIDDRQYRRFNLGPITRPHS